MIDSNPDIEDEAAASLVPLLVVVGTSKELSFLVKENGVALDLSGCSVEAFVWHKPGDTSPLMTWSITSPPDIDGTFSIQLATTETVKAGTKVASAPWGCFLTFGDGRRKQLAHGPIVFSQPGA